MRYQTVLFDVDGTIVDSEHVVMASYAKALKALGMSDPDERLLEISMRDTSINGMIAAGVPDVDAACDLWTEYLAEMQRDMEPCPGIPEVVKVLKAMGCRLGVITSRTHHEVEVDASLRKILPLFDVVVCMEDTETPKPTPAPMFYALEKLGAKPEDALYIGDSPSDAASARAAGIDFALAVWGYRPGEPIRAEYYLTKPEEILGVQHSERTKWLEWAKELQFIAQAGLTYSKDIFDIDRFRRIREISAEIMHEGTDIEIDRLTDLFCNETGYQTPKLSTRAALIENDRILLVRERDGKWALPGGWVDVNTSIGDSAVKEVFEEAGLKAEVVKLVALYDYTRHNRAKFPYGVCDAYFLCRSLGGEFAPNIETTETGWFGLNELPPLSEGKNTFEQIRTCFAARSDDWKPIID